MIIWNLFCSNILSNDENQSHNILLFQVIYGFARNSCVGVFLLPTFCGNSTCWHILLYFFKAAESKGMMYSVAYKVAQMWLILIRNHAAKTRSRWNTLLRKSIWGLKSCGRSVRPKNLNLLWVILAVYF